MVLNSSGSNGDGLATYIRQDRQYTGSPTAQNVLVLFQVVRITPTRHQDVKIRNVDLRPKKSAVLPTVDHRKTFSSLEDRGEHEVGGDYNTHQNS